MIEVKGLTKRYGDVVAVDDVSLAAVAGSILGLLGPNGAGKSTIIGCISGLLRPTAGEIRVQGYDVVTQGREARAQLGIVPQELAIYQEMSATRNLAYWGELYGLRGVRLRERVQKVLEVVGLMDQAHEPVKKFSGGMLRRLNFGCGVVHEPRILLLDEPTVGVDSQSRLRILDLVREEATRGCCVLYVTHYMEEAEELCDRLAIIDHGQNIAMGSLAELRDMIGQKDLLRLTGTIDTDATPKALGTLDGVEILSVDPQSLVLAVEDASHKLPAIFHCLSGAGTDVQETTLTQPSLESLFIELTGRELRE
jgi:linearmycin/streptolysin S transport system ATP-binding protein